MTNKLKDEDHDLFQAHMKGVKPLKKSNIVPTPKPKPTPQPQARLNVIRSIPLEDETIQPEPKPQKLQPKPKFKPGITLPASFRDEAPITAEAILEFGLQQLSPTHLERLKKGLLPLNARIDLHGQNRIDAIQKLERFLVHAHAHHHRNLLIIHGKGAKHGDMPILKHEIFYYLSRHAYTLALRSALPRHGGSGAIYLILKKPQNS